MPEWMKENSQRVSGLRWADIRGFTERKDGMEQGEVDRLNHYNSSSALEFTFYWSFLVVKERDWKSAPFGDLML